jgi:carboxymethylenebutenolidase
MAHLSESQQAMVDLFQKHAQAELDGDLETTMATMTDEPQRNHVPTIMGGFGRDGVRALYPDHLVGKFSRRTCRW